MDKIDFGRKRRTLRSNGFYAVVVICLVAVGIAAWLGVSRTGMFDSGNASQISSPDDTAANDAASSYMPAPAAVKDSVSSAGSRKDNPQAASSAADAASGDAVAAVTPAAGFFVMPITGEIIKNYSDTELQYSITFNDWRLHKAIDVKGVTGDRVNAAGDGTVTDVYEDPLYGMTVEMNHGNGITAVYSGLDTVCVKTGDVLGVNMQIGTLGTVPCESIETTHLHFSMKKGDTSVSPLNIIGV